MANQDEFYIGWMPQAPHFMTRFVRTVLLVLFLAATVLAVVLAVLQKDFSTATFEYGTLTNVSGRYSAWPIPHLTVNAGGDALLVPLVGYGKHGAEGVMHTIQQQRKVSLEGRQITVKGTLLYGDGKTLLQVDENDQPLVSVAGIIPPEVDAKGLGVVVLQGEIVDPKCYFGVMKPGEGKPHKDCAIRCISGGIPPVLVATNNKGEKRYFLLTGKKGEKINQEVLDYVAAPVEVSGSAVAVHDWMVLQVDRVRSVAATGQTQRKQQLAVGCGASSCCKQQL